MLTPNINQTCFNMAEWFALQNEIRETAMQFGYFCLAVGCLLGAFIGWHLAKRKYGKL